MVNRKRKCRNCGKTIETEYCITELHATEKNPTNTWFFCSPDCKFDYDHKKQKQHGFNGLIETIYHSYDIYTIPWGYIRGRLKHMKLDETQAYGILYYLYSVKKIPNLYYKKLNSVIEYLPYYQKEYLQWVKDKKSVTQDFELNAEDVVIQKQSKKEDIKNLSID